MTLARLVYAEAAERQAIAASGATQLDLGGVVRGLQALVAEREGRAAAAEADAASRRRAAAQVQPQEQPQQPQELVDGTRLLLLLEQQAQWLEVERQESLARLEVGAEQAGDMAAVAGRLAGVAGQLAEARSAAQASRELAATLQDALEERELTVGRLGRVLEALRDAQAASDGAGQQRELGRSEGEQRAAIVAEQRAAWGTLQEVARVSHAGEMRQARTPLVWRPVPSFPLLHLPPAMLHHEHVWGWAIQEVARSWLPCQSPARSLLCHTDKNE